MNRMLFSGPRHQYLEAQAFQAADRIAENSIGSILYLTRNDAPSCSRRCWTVPLEYGSSVRGSLESRWHFTKIVAAKTTIEGSGMSVNGKSI